MTPFERLKSPSAILNLFIGLLIASFVGAILGVWLRSATGSATFEEIFVVYMPTVWAPTGASLAIVGYILYRRAKRA